MSVLLHSMIALYRFRRADRQLLYVGRTVDLDRRNGEHTQTDRYREISSIDVEWHPDLDSAILAEALAIDEECPLWNVQLALPRPTFRTQRDHFTWEPQNAAQRAALQEVDRHAARLDLLSEIDRGPHYRATGVRLRQAISTAWDLGVPAKLLAQRARPRNRAELPD